MYYFDIASLIYKNKNIMELDLFKLAEVLEKLNTKEVGGVATSILHKMVDSLLFNPDFEYNEELELDDQDIKVELIMRELLKHKILKDI